MDLKSEPFYYSKLPAWVLTERNPFSFVEKQHCVGVPAHESIPYFYERYCLLAETCSQSLDFRKPSSSWKYLCHTLIMQWNPWDPEINMNTSLIDILECIDWLEWVGFWSIMGIEWHSWVINHLSAFPNEWLFMLKWFLPLFKAKLSVFFPWFTSNFLIFFHLNFSNTYPFCYLVIWSKFTKFGIHKQKSNDRKQKDKYYIIDERWGRIKYKCSKRKNGTIYRYSFKIIFTKEWFEPYVWVTYYCN